MERNAKGSDGASLSVPSEVHHPLFARFFDRLSRSIEPEVGPLRDELLAGLTGRVVEVGAGNGMNFGHYPPTVEQVVAIEPEPYLRARAEVAASDAPVAIEVRSGVADQLDLADASFDGAVACLVLCTVPDQSRALSELHRVLVPSGELRFLEHVRSAASSKARVQALADRSGIWPRIGGGCHCARLTLAAIGAAGFQVRESRTVDVGPRWMITNPHVLGAAGK